MEKNLLHIKNSIAEIHNYLLFVMAELTLMSFIPDYTVDYITIIILGLVPVIFYFIRLKVHKFWLFSILHIFPIFIVWYAVNDIIWAKIIFAVVVFLQIIISFRIRIAVYAHLNRTDYGSGIVLPGFVIGISAALYLANNSAVLTLVFIIVAILHFIYIYISQFLHYVDMSRRTTGSVPTKDIFTVDFALVSGFIFIAVILMSLFIGRNIFINIGTWYLDLIKKIINYLVHTLSFTMFDDVQGTENNLSELLQLEAKEPSKFVIFLDRFFEIMAAVITIALVLAAIFFIVVLIHKVFNKRLHNKKGINDDDADVVEIIEPSNKDEKRKIKINIFSTADEKIRRIFIKAVGKKRKELERLTNECYLISDSHTARELSFLFQDQPDSADLIISLYEKARYAGESCTSADVRMAKKLVDKI